MTYLMTVEISSKEKRLLIKEMLQDMPENEMKKLMLQMSRHLAYSLSEEEKTKFVADLTKAFTSKSGVAYKVPAKPLADEEW